jgi:hypothetical protein
MSPRGPIPRLAEISADQLGLVTRQQALRAGIPPATLARNIKGGLLQRVAQGVYLLAGSPQPDHLELCAAWLQLAPETPMWDRKGGQGVVSHRSAAALYGLGHLVADVQEFTLPHRRQASRAGVRIHVRELEPTEWIALRGLLVTRPSRIAADLLAEHEDPEAVAQITVDALRNVQDYPRTFVDELAPLSSRLGFQRDSGRSVLRWLLEQGGDESVARWSFEQLDKKSVPA